MTTEELIELAIEMRNAQKLYFESRDRSHLNEAKRLERAFDKACDEECLL